jgi:hypothetical protein
VSHREYLLTAIASVIGSIAALFWALAEQPWVAAGCMALSVWATWRVCRYDVRGG